jgi:hypothetical protein
VSAPTKSAARAARRALDAGFVGGARRRGREEVEGEREEGEEEEEKIFLER